MTKGVRISEDMHGELEDRKAEIAEMLGVPERKVNFDDALRTFVYPEDWFGVDAETIRGR